MKRMSKHEQIEFEYDLVELEKDIDSLISVSKKYNLYYLQGKLDSMKDIIDAVNRRI